RSVFQRNDAAILEGVRADLHQRQLRLREDLAAEGGRGQEQAGELGNERLHVMTPDSLLLWRLVVLATLRAVIQRRRKTDGTPSPGKTHLARIKAGALSFPTRKALSAYTARGAHRPRVGRDA